MKPRVAPGRAALTGEYARAAITYWVSVFPRIRHETARWRAYAEQIPDPELRRLALESHAAKKGNVEGASAFGSFAPRGQRGIVVRAQVAFQTMFDYLDTLSEQPSENPIANGDRLNEALLAALDRGRPLADYYAHHPQSEDGGYLHALVSACREALERLPSSAVITPAAIGLAAGLAQYQAFNLRERDGGHSELERWARAETGPGSGLRWWETVAGTSSTLGILALLTAAARPHLTTTDADEIARGYRPWAEALHSLLDSVVDEREDLADGQRSLLAYYSSPQEAADRIGLIATEALRSLSGLPKAHQHRIVLTGMACFYLSPAPATPMGLAVSRAVLAVFGPLTGPTALIFRLKRAVGRRSDQPVTNASRPMISAAETASATRSSRRGDDPGYRLRPRRGPVG